MCYLGQKTVKYTENGLYDPMATHRLTPEEFRKFRLKYVNLMFFVQKIIWADDVVDQAELDFVQEHFPQTLLAALNLTNTDSLPLLLEEALGFLPVNFSHEEKLELIGVCFGAAASTGTVNPAEVAILQVAAEKLGVSNEDLFGYIQTLLI